MILSEKHRLLQKLFREFAEREFTPELIERLDETGEFDWDIYNKMAAAGIMGAKIPVKYGGQGGDSLTHVLMLEEFARVEPMSQTLKPLQLQGNLITFVNPFRIFVKAAHFFNVLVYIFS